MSPQVIFEDIFFPRHSCRLLESSEFVGVFQSLYSPSISFPSLFFPRLFVIFLNPMGIFCARQHLIYLPLKFFDSHCPGSHRSSRDAMRQAKQKETLKPILQGAISKVKTYNDSSLRRKSILLPLVSATCTGKLPGHLKPLPHWCVVDGNRVN